MENTHTHTERERERTSEKAPDAKQLTADLKKADRSPNDATHDR